MKRHNFPPGARAVFAFVGTVVLAFLAAASHLTPDIAVQSVDSMAMLPNGLDQLLPAALFE
jgi:non-ribosomal peptide synthetase component E (peptide arylation enzyme)